MQHPVPAPFRDPDDLNAMLNFCAYRVSIAKDQRQRSFWYNAFDKFKKEMEKRSEDFTAY